jgi:hypothetical protein
VSIVASSNSSHPVSGFQVRVQGPESIPPSDAEVARLFEGQRLPPGRRERLGRSGRIVAISDDRFVGLAAFERADGELRVHEFGVDHSAGFNPEDVSNALLDALEMACLASGARRVLLLPRSALIPGLLLKRGYVIIAEGCAGSWFEKTLV